jgi:hypothetical protein
MPQSTQEWRPSSVGIALAAYQPNPAWLAEQLASLVAQTHTDWHCVITMDSPLQDIRTAPALRPYLHDARFTWIENEERLGVRKNFEKAIGLAAQRGVDLIAFADQDDIWLPEKISTSVSAITKAGPMSLVHTDAFFLVHDELLSETIHSMHRITQTKASVEEIIIYPSISGYLIVLDAELVRRHPNVPEAMRYHDHWYSVVATSYGGVHRIDEALAFDRQHENNTVGISSVRVGTGLNPIKVAPTGRSAVHERGVWNIGSARVAAHQLPIGPVRRLLFQYRIGWILCMISIIIRRSFDERLFVVQAYRALIAQLLVFPPQLERARRLRARLPIPGRIVPKLRIAALITALIVCVVLPQQIITMVTTFGATLWIAVAAAAAIGPAWRFARHGYPGVGATLVALSALAAASARLISDSGLVSVVVFALPLAWHLAYRLRWRGDTGY